MLFDTHLIVDWSARSTPSPARPSGDAIWIGAVRDGGTPEVAYIRTRAAAVARLGDLLAAELAAGRRVIAGFDFPFGYPRGVARRLTGRDRALALWEWLAARIEDAPDNANNRFAVAEAINRHYDGLGPCWGRPATWTHPDLPTTSHERHGTDHPPAARLADTLCGASSVWQMAYAGSVGSQALLGLPALRRLIMDPRLAPHVAVWPIGTGLAVPQAPLVLAEVYPSLINRAIQARRAPGEIKDRAQVRVLAAALAALDARNGLGALLRGPADLSPADRAAVGREESWMLGLGAVHRLEAALDAVLPVASPERADATSRRLRGPRTAARADDLATAQVPAARAGAGRDGAAAPAPGLAAPLRKAPPATTAASGSGDAPPVSGGGNHRRRPAAQGAEGGDADPRQPPPPACRPRSVPAPAGDGPRVRGPALRYVRDPAEIYRLSFQTVRDEARLDHLPDDLAAVAVRLVHACGMPEITARLAWSADVAAAARNALRAGAPVLCDCEAVAAMVIRNRLPAGNAVLCTLNDLAVPDLARAIGNTRSAAAVELWRDRLEGAVVAIGNAPTALFHLLELLDAGWPRPAAILGFPVGFVGAAESKAELAARPRGAPFLTLRGRRGGSALAAAAVNALAGEP